MTITVVNELAIALPFVIDDFGTVNATAEQDKIWADRVRGVIGTALGERVYRPEFGCEAALVSFDNEELVLNTIEDSIRASFQSFLPLLALESVLVSVDEYTRVINVEVVYSTTGGASYLIKVGIATINGTNPISEEISWQIQ